MTRWRILPALGLILLLVLSLVLAACGDNTPTTAPAPTTAAPTTAAATTVAPTTAANTTAAPTTAAATTAASTTAAVTAATSSPFELVRKIDTSGLNMNLTTSALDAQGNFYTLDARNSNIVKFDPNGKILTKWGKKGSGDGEILFSDDANPQLPKGGGIGVDPQGNVYFADTYNHRIQKFDSEGRLLGKLSNLGKGDGQFETPAFIIFDKQGNYYILDYTANPIQKFDKDGKFLARIGSKGEGEGQVSNVGGIGVDSQGNIYVSDFRIRGAAVDGKGNPIFENFDNRVLKFDSNGKYLSSFGSSGSGDGQFRIVGRIVFDSQDNIYISDQTSGITKFNKAGKFVAKLQNPGNGDPDFRALIWVLIDGKDNLYLTDAVAGIYQFRLRNTGAAPAATTAATTNSNPVELVRKVNTSANVKLARAMGIDKQGNMYIVDAMSHSISKIDSTGKLVTTWGKKGSGEGEFNFSRDQDPMKYGGFVAIDSQSNVYVSDIYNHRIQKFDTNGKFLTMWGGKGQNDGQFDTPLTLVLDNQANVYVGDFTGRIQKFDANGKFLSKFSNPGSNEGQLPIGFINAIDKQGNFYVADVLNNRIQIFDSNWKFLRGFGSEGSGEGQFVHPTSVVLDSKGNMYVGDDAGRTQIFSPNLKYIGQYNGLGNGQSPSVENYIGGPYIDSNDNIYIFDANILYVLRPKL